MTKYYINLSDCHYDDLKLDASQVDLVNYDNNNGYSVYCLAICDENENVVKEFNFKSMDDLNDFAKNNGLDIVNSEWIYDSEAFDITCDNGDYDQYTIPCKCDVLINYCVYLD